MLSVIDLTRQTPTPGDSSPMVTPLPRTLLTKFCLKVSENVEGERTELLKSIFILEEDVSAAQSYLRGDQTRIRTLPGQTSSACEAAPVPGTGWMLSASPGVETDRNMKKKITCKLSESVDCNADWC